MPKIPTTPRSARVTRATARASSTPASPFPAAAGEPAGAESNETASAPTTPSRGLRRRMSRTKSIESLKETATGVKKVVKSTVTKTKKTAAAVASKAKNKWAEAQAHYSEVQPGAAAAAAAAIVAAGSSSSAASALRFWDGNQTAANMSAYAATAHATTPSPPRVLKRAAPSPTPTFVDYNEHDDIDVVMEDADVDLLPATRAPSISNEDATSIRNFAAQSSPESLRKTRTPSGGHAPGLSAPGETPDLTRGPSNDNAPTPMTPAVLDNVAAPAVSRKVSLTSGKENSPASSPARADKGQGKATATVAATTAAPAALLPVPPSPGLKRKRSSGTAAEPKTKPRAILPAPAATSNAVAGPSTASGSVADGPAAKRPRKNNSAPTRPPRNPLRGPAAPKKTAARSGIQAPAPDAGQSTRTLLAVPPSAVAGPSAQPVAGPSAQPVAGPSTQAIAAPTEQPTQTFINNEDAHAFIDWEAFVEPENRGKHGENVSKLQILELVIRVSEMMDSDGYVDGSWQPTFEKGMRGLMAAGLRPWSLEPDIRKWKKAKGELRDGYSVPTSHVRGEAADLKLTAGCPHPVTLARKKEEAGNGIGAPPGTVAPTRATLLIPAPEDGVDFKARQEPGTKFRYPLPKKSKK